MELDAHLMFVRRVVVPWNIERVGELSRRRLVAEPDHAARRAGGKGAPFPQARERLVEGDARFNDGDGCARSLLRILRIPELFEGGLHAGLCGREADGGRDQNTQDPKTCHLNLSVPRAYRC